MFRHDLATRGRQQPLTGGAPLRRRDFRVLVDFRAGGSRPAPQRGGQIGRRDVAIVRVVEGADDLRGLLAVAEVDQGPQTPDFLRINDAEGHTDRIGSAAVLEVLVHALATGRQAQVSRDMKTDVLVRLGGEALVQIHGVLVQLPDRVAHVEQRQEPRGVPGGAGGELGALNEHDVGPALLRQVVQGADANGTTANHHHARVRSHPLVPLPDLGIRSRAV